MLKQYLDEQHALRAETQAMFDEADAAAQPIEDENQRDELVDLLSTFTEGVTPSEMLALLVEATAQGLHPGLRDLAAMGFVTRLKRLTKDLEVWAEQYVDMFDTESEQMPEVFADTQLMTILVNRLVEVAELRERYQDWIIALSTYR